MGCGRIGAATAAALSEEGCRVNILDLNKSAFDLLPKGMIDDGHIVPIIGDGTLESDLRKASTHECDVFIAVSGKDTRDALGAQIAKHVLQVPVVVCRMNDPIRKEMYGQLGLVTISATNLVTDMIVEAAAAR